MQRLDFAFLPHGQGGEHHLVESLLHLLVGEAQGVAELVAALDGEVARLVEEQGGTASRHVGCLQDVAQDAAVVEIAQAQFGIVEELGEERGGAGGSPEVLEFGLCQRIDKAVGIIDVHHVVFREMVAVVIFLQSVVGFLCRPFVARRHLFQLRLEVLPDLFLRNAAEGSVFGLETDVGQVVECGEQGDLRKLGDARDEDKLLVLVVSLQDGEHLPVHCRASLVLGSFPGMLQGGVVLVDEDDDLLSRLPVGGDDDGVEAVGEVCRGLGRDAVRLFVFPEPDVEVGTDGFRRSPSPAHVETDDGMCLPVLFQVHDLQSLEEFLLPLKVRLQRVDEQRFAEPAGSAEVTEPVAVVRQFPHDVGLVHIQVVFLPYLMERLYAYRKSSALDACHNNLFLYIY